MAGNRRRKWVDRMITETTADGTQDVEDLLAFVDEEDTKGITIVRHIIDLSITAAPVLGDDTDIQVYAVGIGIFSREAVTAGNFPDPDAQTQVPMTGWLWRTRLLVANNAAVGPIRLQLDLRAQRKMMYGTSYIVMTNKDSQGVAFSVDTVGIVRTLLLLA